MRLKIACHLSGLIVACLAPAASAVDGVLEINEACAVNTGCFAGDTAGFPVTITSPGSYRLTGNLSSGSGSRTEISADSVTLDLNGNRVGVGVESSTGTISSTGENTRISNGAVEGSIGTAAISITGSCGHVDHVRTIGNVHLGRQAQVTDSAITGRGSADEDQALRTGEISVVTGNTVIGSMHAIDVGAGSVIRNNAIRTGYFGGGIVCSDCTIDSNAIRIGGDVGFGIRASNSVVTENVVKGNPVNEIANGIICSTCTVIGNVVTDFNEFGLVDSAGTTGYANNQFDNNNGGNANPQVSGGIEMGTNICGGDTTCP